jgi:hypothetical protein
MPLRVRSDYIDKNQNAYIFYISGFEEVIQYFHLASNMIFYSLILTNEMETTVQALDAHLKTKKRNPEFDRRQICFHTQSEEQKDWCIRAGFQSRPLTDDIRAKLASPEYIPTLCEKPNWGFNGYSIYHTYYSDSLIKIIRLEGLEHNWDMLHLLRPHMHLFVQIPWLFGKWNFEFARNTLFTKNPLFPTTNIYWECPNLDTFLFCHEYEFMPLLINHNCWLDYDCMNYAPTEKKFDMVMNCRPENWKRPFLAKQVNDLAYIKGYNFKKHDYYDYKQLSCKFVNELRISPTDVNRIYNESYCGGIFSAVEGACYSSSEYLLSGLPVVSTESVGGRDVWYTLTNSIIVDATEEAVTAGVALAKQKLADGSFNPEKIRAEHIAESERMRSLFNDTVQGLFVKHGVSVDAKELFAQKYYHKFKSTMKLEEVIADLSTA